MLDLRFGISECLILGCNRIGETDLILGISIEQLSAENHDQSCHCLPFTIAKGVINSISFPKIME